MNTTLAHSNIETFITNYLIVLDTMSEHYTTEEEFRSMIEQSDNYTVDTQLVPGNITLGTLAGLFNTSLGVLISRAGSPAPTMAEYGGDRNTTNFIIHVGGRNVQQIQYIHRKFGVEALFDTRLSDDGEMLILAHEFSIARSQPTYEIKSSFGTWNEALEEAGMKPMDGSEDQNGSNEKKYTSEEVMERIRELGGVEESVVDVGDMAGVEKPEDE